MLARRQACLLRHYIGLHRSQRQPQSRGCRSTTLDVAVRELRKQGRLQATEPAGYRSSSPIFEDVVDLDAELAAAATLDPEQLELDEEDGYESAGEVGGDSDGDFGDAMHDGSSTEHGIDVHRMKTFEDVALIPEEELKERVRRSIEELIPPSTASASSGGVDSTSLSGLTPSQIFFMENKERLVNRAQEYYLEKQLEQQMQQESVERIEDEWRFYHEPVVRPPKGHLWSTGEDNEHGSEKGWLETVETWTKGELPTVEMIAELLRREQAKDIHVVDLHACGRYDVGTHSIVATGVTTGHCRRLGEIAAKATQSCEAPHIEAFCFGTRDDEWVVAHCGPIKVHLLTRECRELYRLEDLWERPEDFFALGDFPHYVEVYGSASQAPSEGHITDPMGSRSTKPLPPPFADHLHDVLAIPDYEAAEDSRFTSSASFDANVEVGGSRQQSSDSGNIDVTLDVEEARRRNVDLAFGTQLDLDAEVDTDDEDEDRSSLPKESGKEAEPLHRL